MPGDLSSSRPIRRACFLLGLGAVANLLLAVTALAINDAWLEVVFPVGAVASAAAPLVAVVALALGALDLYAVRQLMRVAPNGRRVAVAASAGTLLNAPLGTVLGLLALAHLQQPRVRRVFVERERLRAATRQA